MIPIIVSALLVAAPVWGEEEKKAKEAQHDISEEDMEVIKHMEILEMMEIAKNLEVLREMDILIEDEAYEEKN